MNTTTTTTKLTNSETLHAILGTLNAPATVKAVAELGNVSTSTARKFLTKNVERGLVTKIDGRPARFEMSEAGTAEVERIAAIRGRRADAKAKREADAIAAKAAEEKATADRLASFADAPAIPGAADQADAAELAAQAVELLGAIELPTTPSRYDGEAGHYGGRRLENSLTRLTIRVAGAGSSYATYSLGGWTAQAEGRLVMHGAQVQGPHAWLGENATCIAADPNAGTAADNARAEAASLMVATEVGALVVAAGAVYRIERGPAFDTRPKLVGVTASELRRLVAEAAGQPEATTTELASSSVVTEHKAARPDPSSAAAPTWLVELKAANAAAEAFGQPLPFEGNPVAQGGTWKAGTYHELYANGGTLRAFLADDGTEMARLTVPAFDLDPAELEKLRAVFSVEAPSSAADLPRAIADATKAVEAVELDARAEVARAQAVADAANQCKTCGGELCTHAGYGWDRDDRDAEGHALRSCELCGLGGFSRESLGRDACTCDGHADPAPFRSSSTAEKNAATIAGRAEAAGTKVAWVGLLRRDPRKAAAVAELLKAAGVERGKVTGLEVTKAGDTVRGSVLTKRRGARSWDRAGEFYADLPERSAFPL